ncbi:MAG: PepSY domain-containing protein [Methanobacteriaceae archaeon]
MEMKKEYIIIALAIVGLIGILVGFMVLSPQIGINGNQSQLNNDSNLNVDNSSQNISNNGTNNSNNQNSDENLISPEQAKKVAEASAKNMDNPNVYAGSVNLVRDNDRVYYAVELLDKKTNKATGQINVDAKTGKQTM